MKASPAFLFHFQSNHVRKAIRDGCSACYLFIMHMQNPHAPYTIPNRCPKYDPNVRICTGCENNFPDCPTKSYKKDLFFEWF